MEPIKPPIIPKNYSTAAPPTNLPGLEGRNLDKGNKIPVQKPAGEKIEAQAVKVAKTNDQPTKQPIKPPFAPKTGTEAEYGSDSQNTKS